MATTWQWWPTKTDSESTTALVEVGTADGQVCGHLQQIDTSGITLTADGQDVSVGLDEVVWFRSVTAC